MLKDMYKMEGFLLDDIDVALKMDATLSLEKKESNFDNITVEIPYGCRQQRVSKYNRE